MATPNLGLNRPLHGTFPDTWDVPANFNWDVIDAAFAALGIHDLPVPGTGHTHDGTAGQGPKIRHQDLSGAGVLTHTQLDAGSEKVKVTAADTTADHLNLKVVAGVNITLNVLNPGANEQLEIVSTGGGSPWVAADEYGAKHTVPTSAPVAYTDNFTYPPQTLIRDCGYVRSTSAASFEFYTTGYSAMAYVDPTKGDAQSAQYAATAACHIPHGRAQRVTLSLTNLDYSELGLNDTIEFTLALHSTHTLGAHLPQQLGVVLDLHFTVVAVAPTVIQVTHRIFILPNATDKILLFECHNHANPMDILGCWELAMDSNGHVYHYWRRNLVYSSQTLPNSLPGPVAAYFAALSASLAALGEPKYGAMGFGCQYSIGMFSKFNVEARWLSVTSDCDVYDEVPPACPGPLPPVGMPTITPLPWEFWFVVPGGQVGGVPGAECCPGPPSVRVGDVLESDPVTGEPTVWVTGCNEIPIDTTFPLADRIGFSTNQSWDVCFPCKAPSGTPTIFNPPTDWPKEGTTGAIIVHGISPLPPYMEIISSTPGFVVVDAVWLNWQEFLLKYVILDGYSGTAVTLTLRNKYVPLITYTFPFVTIVNGLPIILAIDWLDTYEGTHSNPTEGYEFNATITGSGFDVGCTLTTPTGGVTIVSFNRISDSEIDAVIKFAYDMGTSFGLRVSNPDGHTVLNTYALAYTPPVVAWKTLVPDTLIGGPGVPRTADFYGNFFAPGISIVVNPLVPLGTVNVTGFARISQTHAQVTFDTMGGLGAQVDFDIIDAARGFTLTVPLFQVGDIAPPTIAGIVLDPTPVYNGGALHPYQVTVNSGGANFGVNSYILIAGPYANGEVYGTSGDVHTLSMNPGQGVAEFRAWCASGPGMVNLQVVKPGVGSAALVPAFATAVPPGPLLAPAVAWGAGLEPGAAGVLTVVFGGGACHLAEAECTSPYITLSGRVWTAPNTITYNYTVDAAAVENAPYSLNFRNGPCAAITAVFSGNIEYLTPTISAVQIPTQEWQPNVEGYVVGTGFRAGAAVAFGGQAVFVGAGAITPTRIPVTVTHLAAGGATAQVTNADGKIAGPFGYAVTAEPTPDVNHCEAVPAITGSIGAKMYVYGDGLNPGGAVYTFVGFNVTAVNRTIDNYLEFTGNIVAPAGNWITLQIASTATPGGYPVINLVRAEASPGGAVLIHSVGTPTAKDNQLGVLQIIEGENLDQIILVEADPVTPALLNRDYIPVTATPAVSLSIVSSTPARLVLSMDIGKGVTPNAFNLLFYGVGPVLLATAPSAFTALGSDTAPQISASDRLVLDGVIPSGAGVGWVAAVVVSGPMPWLFGDTIEAAGFTLTIPPTYNPLLQTWTVNGLNGIVGSPWQLKIKNPTRPASPDECVYRIPGGVVT